jgi:hypothetical protein
MRTLSVALLSALVVAVSITSAHAFDSSPKKCRLQKDKYSKAQQKVDRQESKVAALENNYANVQARGDERTAMLQSNLADAEGQMTGVGIQTGADAVACWLSPNRCADSTVRRAGNRYGQAVRLKERAEGALAAWLASVSKRLDALTKRITKENSELAIRQEALSKAEAAYEACVG